MCPRFSGVRETGSGSFQECAANSTARAFQRVGRLCASALQSSCVACDPRLRCALRSLPMTTTEAHHSFWRSRGLLLKHDVELILGNQGCINVARETGQV